MQSMSQPRPQSACTLLFIESQCSQRCELHILLFAEADSWGQTFNVTDLCACLCWDFQKLSTPDVQRLWWRKHFQEWFCVLYEMLFVVAPTLPLYKTSIHWKKHPLTARVDFSYYWGQVWRKELKKCQSSWDAVCFRCLIYLEFFHQGVWAPAGLSVRPEPCVIFKRKQQSAQACKGRLCGGGKVVLKRKVVN